MITPIPIDYVEEHFPDAWSAIPECYKADSCLDFYVDTFGDLFSLHDLGEEYMWNGDDKEWCICK